VQVANKKPHLWNEIKLIEEIGRIVKSYNVLRFGAGDGDGAIKEKHIVYAAAYPDYVFDLTGEGTVRHTQMICYDITRKESGSIGPNKMDRNKRERPIIMEQVPAVVNAGTDSEKQVSQTTLMKHYDLTLRFDCLAASDHESMILVRDFERMMEIHAPYLETGCKRFIYDGRRPSYFNRDTRYKSRTCQFFAQVEEHWYMIDDKIEEINVKYLNFEAAIQ